jgi:2-deoxy-D-gluconate 3-dehydrogenase
VNDRIAVLFSLEGKRALVTGASRGLGRAMAEALAGAGADVVCASSKAGGARETAEAVRALGRRAWEVDADLADRDAVLAMADRAVRDAGQIDVLVNNGGTIRRHAAVDHPLEDWDAVLRTNLDSVFVLSQRLGRAMVERGAGKIVNVASLLSFSGGITVPGYTASKHAVAGVTKALANEWARYGVQVNAIAPGYFSTDNTERLRADERRYAEISARIPAARWGEPSDLAGAVVFLASRASDYVNGHVLVVDGGWMAR